MNQNRREKDIKIAAWLAVGLAAILGVCLLVFPNLAANIVIYGVALFSAVFGAYRIIRYFGNPPGKDAYDFGLALGLCFLTIGVLAALFPLALVDLFSTLIGALLVAGCFVKLQVALDEKRAGAKLWYLFLIAAMVSLATGVITVTVYYITPLYTGVVLLAEAVMDAAVMIVKLRAEKTAGRKPAAQAAKEAEAVASAKEAEPIAEPEAAPDASEAAKEPEPEAVQEPEASPSPAEPEA